MTHRRQAHRPLVWTALAALVGASITLTAQSGFAAEVEQIEANQVEANQVEANQVEAEQAEAEQAEAPSLPDTEISMEPGLDVDIELDELEPDQAISDRAGPDVDAIRSAIGRRSSRRIDSLSVALFGDQREALWPMQIGVEVVSASGGEVVVPLRDVVVSDGQHTIFSEVIEAPRGKHTFELELVARHHFGDAIELEYDLDIRQARFESLTWGSYLLHRMALAPRPQVGDDALAAARADIVEIEDRPSEPAHRQIVTVDGQRYEIRLYAETLRG